VYDVEFQSPDGNIKINDRQATVISLSVFWLSMHTDKDLCFHSEKKINISAVWHCRHSMLIMLQCGIRPYVPFAR